MPDVAARQRREGFLFLIGFAACVPAANWLIGHVGTSCIPDGPCVIPVAPGIAAPSGVLMVGLALVLRDLVQRRLGLAWSLAAIAKPGPRSPAPASRRPRWSSPRRRRSSFPS